MTRPLLLILAPLLLAAAGCSAVAAGGVPDVAGTHSARPDAAASVSASASSTPVPASSPAPLASAAPAAQAQAADATVTGFLHTSSLAAADPASTTDLSSSVGGALLDDLQAQLEELEDNGWTSTGTAVADDIHVLRSTTKGDVTTLTVEACVDSSDVVVLDADGTPLPTDPTTARAKTIYTLTDDGTGLLVTDRTYPDNPSC
jgi:hypothetical protein